MRIVELRIDPGGQVRLETRGFAGRGCLKAAMFLKTCLGKLVGEQLTGEFYWLAPGFCTRSYESMGWVTGKGSRAANSAGVWYPNALCGRR